MKKIENILNFDIPDERSLNLDRRSKNKVENESNLDEIDENVTNKETKEIFEVEDGLGENLGSNYGR